jgi:hypothetical protein
MNDRFRKHVERRHATYEKLMAKPAVTIGTLPRAGVRKTGDVP